LELFAPATPTFSDFSSVFQPLLTFLSCLVRYRIKSKTGSTFYFYAYKQIMLKFTYCPHIRKTQFWSKIPPVRMSGRKHEREQPPPEDVTSQDTGLTASEGEVVPALSESVLAALAETAAVRVTPDAQAEGARSTRASRSRSATPSLPSTPPRGEPSKRPRHDSPEPSPVPSCERPMTRSRHQELAASNPSLEVASSVSPPAEPIEHSTPAPPPDEGEPSSAADIGAADPASPESDSGTPAPPSLPRTTFRYVITCYIHR